MSSKNHGDVPSRDGQRGRQSVHVLLGRKYFKIEVVAGEGTKRIAVRDACQAKLEVVSSTLCGYNRLFPAVNNINFTSIILIRRLGGPTSHCPTHTIQRKTSATALHHVGVAARQQKPANLEI